MAFANIRGVSLEGCKNALNKSAIAEIKNSATFCIPLKCGKGAESKPVVTVDENVKFGGIIASPVGNNSGFIYSPVSGSVTKIEESLNALGEHCTVVEITPALKEIKVNFKPLKELSQTNLFGRLVESGSFDNWGDRYPSYCKYINPNAKNIKTVIVKLYDSDSFVFSNTMLAKHYAKEVLMGAVLFYKVASAYDLIFVGNTDLGIVENLMKENFGAIDIPPDRVKFLKVSTKYPSDEEHLLAKQVINKTIKITEQVAANGVVIENAQSCFNFYNAVYLNEPTTKTLYSIAGDNIKQNGLCFVKNGTRPVTLFETFKIDDTSKFNSFSVGGIMAGYAQCYNNVGLPITISSLQAQKSPAKFAKEIDCINCGRCNAVCPTRLAPMMLDSFALDGDFAKASKYGVSACINCGNCSYVCPAKRHLAQRISDTKTAIEEGRTL